MNQAVMFSSASDEWATPQELFDRLNAVFHFDLDPAATPENAKCAKYYTTKENGLVQSWRGNVWLNPPYGREIGAWVKKAYEEVTRGGGYFGGAATSSPNGHGVVSRLLQEGLCYVFARAAQIRWRKERRAVPEHDCDFYEDRGRYI